ncbi:MAG: LPXTG cell wall anchor domain-containing protein [Clostridia bacterium]|nr:LPXTG cell wall anchor domain-containing protein [Clostridia bacterium]
MKLTKKIATLALTLILVLTLAVPALAADPVGGTLTVKGATLTNPDDYTKYTVYKMLTVQDGNTDLENKYTVDDNWKPFVTREDMEDYFVVKETADGTYVVWAKNTTSIADAAAIAELARKFVTDNQTVANATKVGEVTVNGAALPIPTNGYYLLVPDNQTASGVVVVKNGRAIEVTEKSVAPGMPTIEKLVYEDSIQGYTTANTADVGSKIQYKVTIIAGQGASEYVLHDHVDEHITFDPASVKITRGGNEVQASEFDLVTTGITDGCTFHIVFDKEWCKGLNEGAVIVVTYEGTLIGEEQNGEWSEVDTDTDHKNTAYLTHTAAAVKTDETFVSTQTYELNVLKQDQNQAPLEGAGFVLRDNEKNYYKYENGVVSWVTDINDATEYFSDENGKLRFYGLDAEIMYLVEKTVPGGYTGVEETQVNLKSGSVKAGNAVEVIKVTNTLGQALPETGGIGTTVFYIGGAVLVVCALVVLIVMKKKDNKAE